MRWIALFIILIIPTLGSLEPQPRLSDLASTQTFRCEEAFGFTASSQFLETVDSELQLKGLSLFPSADYEPSEKALASITKLIAKSPTGAKLRWQDARSLQAILFKDWRIQSLKKIWNSDNGVIEKIQALSDIEIEGRLYNYYLEPATEFASEPVPDRMKFISWSRKNFGFIQQTIDIVFTAYSLIWTGTYGLLIPKWKWFERKAGNTEIREAYLEGGVTKALALIRANNPDLSRTASIYGRVEKVLRVGTTILLAGYMVHSFHDRLVLDHLAQGHQIELVEQLKSVNFTPPTPAEEAEQTYREFASTEGKDFSPQALAKFRADVYRGFGVTPQ